MWQLSLAHLSFWQYALLFYVFLTLLYLSFNYSAIVRMLVLIIGVFIFLPILFVYTSFPLFSYLKLASAMMVCVYLFCLRRFTTHFLKTQLAKNIFYLLIFINIFEACWVDFINEIYLNALLGVLLLLTMPSAKRINFDTTQPYWCLWDIELSWCISYSLWNFIFVLKHYPHKSLELTMLLCFSLIIAIYDNKQWMQARIYSLSIYLLFFSMLKNVRNIPWHTYHITLSTSQQILVNLAGFIFLCNTGASKKIINKIKH